MSRRLKPGDSTSVSRVIFEKDIEDFAQISLDRNLVHFDKEFCKSTFWGKPIAHGTIGASLISGALTKLMGDGNIWLSANLKFENPAFVGDQLNCVITVNSINRRGIADIDVAITRNDKEKVLSGNVQCMNFVRN
jgi:acyl dehydratase